MERILAALGRSWALLGRPWDACWALLARSWTLVGASGRSWALLGFEVSFGRIWGGSGQGSGRVCAAFCSGPARVQVRKQFQMIVLAFACFCLLVQAIARQSVELILNLNSSWLSCLCLALPWFAWLYLALPCFTLLCLTLLMRFPFHCSSGLTISQTN